MITRSGTKLASVIGAVCATVLTLSTPAAHAATTDTDHSATLAALKAFQAAAGPGAAVHAGNADESWTLSAGTGTVNANRPIKADEHIRIGSQTKTFTAVVVLQLAEEGRVSLDLPIDDYLPGVVTGNGYDGTRITVRHLLQHTGGLGAYTPSPGLKTPPSNPDGTFSLSTIVRYALDASPPVSAPGEGFTYSNTDYYILGMLIEKLTGQPVHQAVTERVIEPIGLPRTTFPAPGDRTLPAPAVSGYHGIRVGPLYAWIPAVSYDPSLFSSAGAMISTLEDLTAFYQALANGKVLSAKSLAEMRTARQVNPGRGYGLGLQTYEPSCGGTARGHSGGVPGYQTFTLTMDDGRYVSIVTNLLMQVGQPDAQLVKLLDTALCEDAPQRD
ncbi:serine hydrolase domain-containing protein [Streptomyces sp. NRRL S-37]|uniref:serine hydrolase domain-containing protein n=1 Tax=Streptomyces sp. NRRL S-37 TaxID=1463903 RepID=UPI0004C80871|nr:serine hydrolase domain-containing protein [Streptomyces sp. NRRL S-37]